MRNSEDLNIQIYQPLYFEVTKIGHGYMLTYVEQMVILTHITRSVLFVFYCHVNCLKIRELSLGSLILQYTGIVVY